MVSLTLIYVKVALTTFPCASHFISICHYWLCTAYEYRNTWHPAARRVQLLLGNGCLLLYRKEHEWLPGWSYINQYMELEHRNRTGIMIVIVMWYIFLKVQPEKDFLHALSVKLWFTIWVWCELIEPKCLFSLCFSFLVVHTNLKKPLGTVLWCSTISRMQMQPSILDSLSVCYLWSRNRDKLFWSKTVRLLEEAKGDTLSLCVSSEIWHTLMFLSSASYLCLTQKLPVSKAVSKLPLKQFISSLPLWEPPPLFEFSLLPLHDLRVCMYWFFPSLSPSVLEGSCVPTTV